MINGPEKKNAAEKKAIEGERDGKPTNCFREYLANESLNREKVLRSKRRPHERRGRSLYQGPHIKGPKMEEVGCNYDAGTPAAEARSVYGSPSKRKT